MTSVTGVEKHNSQTVYGHVSDKSLRTVAVVFTRGALTLVQKRGSYYSVWPLMSNVM